MQRPCFTALLATAALAWAGPAAAFVLTDVSSVAFRSAEGQPIVLIHDSRGFVLEGGQEIQNFFGPGVAWADLNHDRWPDLMVGNGSLDNQTGQPVGNYLLLNNGDGTFTDVSAAWGVATSRGADGVAFVDTDNDGQLELAIANYFKEPQFYLGALGGMAEQSVAVGVNPLLPSTQGDVRPEAMGVAFGDYDHDGFVDMYVANYLNQPDVLFHSLRGTYFERRADVSNDVVQEFGFQPVFLDFDNDGDLDIYVANDFGPNYLFENQGEASGWAFVERADQFKVAGGQTSADPYSMDMGVAVGDYDNDGDLDMYTTIFNGNALYENLGAQPGGLWRFRNRAVDAGVKFGLNCWGTDFCDLDNDGDLDLLVTGGFIDGRERQPTAIRDQVYLNQGPPNWVFRDVGAEVGFADTSMGRGLATADYDRDGDLDVVITHNSFHDPWPGASGAVLYEGHAMLFRNDLHDGGHWVSLLLQGGGEHRPGLGCNRGGIGARVSLTAGGATQIREVQAGSSYLSMNSLEVEFGLGARDAIDAVSVRWPCGAQETFTGITPDRFYTLVEGQGVAVPDPVVIETFAATGAADDPAITLQWRVAASAPDLELMTVELQREVVTGPGDPLLLSSIDLPVEGTATEGSARDAGVEQGITYAYRLLLRGPSGVVAASPTLQASPGEHGDPPPTLPTRPVLGQNFPNPFNPGTTILFELPRQSAARVTLYDAQGRQVRTLVDGQFEAGPHQVVWDGQDNAGRAVASGAYFYALETPDGASTRRLVLIR